MSLPKEVRAALSIAGKAGVKARMKKLTAEKRREIARHAAKTRWAKVKP